MIICDLDGCIFDNRHRKHLIPADRTYTPNWDEFNQACLEDSPIFQVIRLVKYMARLKDGLQFKYIVFLTSRGESSRANTIRQLKEHFPSYKFDLIMRSSDDHRSTVDYKKSALNQLSDNFSNDSVIIDDHPGIIKMVETEFPSLNRLLVPSFDCTVIGD